MNIAFTGAHCTGKTTLLKEVCRCLARKNVSTGYITAIAREIINKGYPLNKDATVDSYIHYMNEQLFAEERMNTYDIFISDRSLLDPVAYAVVNDKLSCSCVQSYFVELMKRVWLMEKEKYDLYVYFPIEFEMEEDGIRPVDEEYRQAVDNQIQVLLKENKINYITITGTIDERRKTLLEIVERCKEI